MDFWLGEEIAEDEGFVDAFAQIEAKHSAEVVEEEAAATAAAASQAKGEGEVIVIDDSDEDDRPQGGAGSASLPGAVNAWDLPTSPAAISEALGDVSDGMVERGEVPSDMLVEVTSTTALQRIRGVASGVASDLRRSPNPRFFRQSNTAPLGTFALASRLGIRQRAPQAMAFYHRMNSLRSSRRRSSAVVYQRAVRRYNQIARSSYENGWGHHGEFYRARACTVGMYLTPNLIFCVCLLCLYTYVFTQFLVCVCYTFLIIKLCLLCLLCLCT